ncbi:hypothetical protein T09_4957 [Trichinella sp. T9]|nr:hypothetical protein T09_4957 [Trichinella sp. T9]
MKGATPNKLVKGVTANQMSIIGIETEPAECNATGYTSGTIPLRNGQSHLLKVDPASTGTCAMRLSRGGPPTIQRHELRERFTNATTCHVSQTNECTLTDDKAPLRRSLFA